MRLGSIREWLEIEWEEHGIATTYYSWAFLLGAVPGYLHAGLVGIAVGWVPVAAAYVLRSRRYREEFDAAREQILAVVSALFCWILWYAGPLMWFTGWSRNVFSLEMEEHMQEQELGARGVR